MVRSLAPRAATTTVAIGISEEIGGIPGVTAVVVILSAIVGVTAGPPLMRMLNIRDDRAIGLALGVSAHVLGVGRAFQISETAGAFASIGMVLNMDACDDARQELVASSSHFSTTRRPILFARCRYAPWMVRRSAGNVPFPYNTGRLF